MSLHSEMIKPSNHQAKKSRPLQYLCPFRGGERYLSIVTNSFVLVICKKNRRF